MDSLIFLSLYFYIVHAIISENFFNKLSSSLLMKVIQALLFQALFFLYLYVNKTS